MIGLRFIWVAINLVLLLCLTGITVYAFILFIRLARKGIVALDLWIDKNKDTL
ncbi:MAG: hypothetical protein N2484_05770 [Clostridia bacterium]|nr:hypothetical protein [Clostridia bacterium]